MDRSVKAREARARLPRRGAFSWAFGRRYRAVVCAVFAVVFVVALRWPLEIGLGGGLLLLPVYVQAWRARRRSQHALELSEEGRLDQAADTLERAVRLGVTLPVTRAILGISLASCYLRLGEIDLAIVVLREIEASEALPEVHRPTLRHYQALALVARGELSKAGAVLSGLEPSGVAVIVAALAGQPEEAARIIEAMRAKQSALPAHLVLPRRRVGALFLAYAFDRRVRENPADARAADLRDRSLSDAAGLERHRYAYFVHAWPELVGFADLHLAKAKT